MSRSIAHRARPARTIRRASIRHADHGGFTLLEVLLAMVILAVIMTVVYASFSTAGRNIEQAETIRDETDIARTLIARLSVDIANAYPQGSAGFPSVPTRFYGKKEEVEGGTGAGNEKIRHD